ncbi:type I methionyl aminopeptidase [Variovorax sp. YR752]|uniref:type I methionyl aminopeptidase n=1 Tax=Variovorax sp. YR752 TaxID=1884383 RepID=UPI0031376FA1
MTIESQADVEALQRIGSIVSRVLERMLDALEPGITTAELDALGERWLAEAGARSAPRLSYNFPGATCISVNEEAAHGIPGPRVIRAGDLVNVDVSAELDGYFADTGGSRAVPPVSPIKQRLCHATRTALDNAMRQARAGMPINAIGRAIEQTARAHRFRIIRNLASHGVGRALHEEPTEIAGYHDPRDRRLLHEGMVITIEPFLSTKSTVVDETGDGWTLAGAPGNLSAQYEHTMIITRGEPIVVTRH